MKLYFDSCCYGRPYDDLTDLDIATDAAAIMKITTLARTYGGIIFGSLANEKEINANPEESTRADALRLYNRTITVRADYVGEVFTHFAPLARAAGVEGYDVYHLCYAIAAGVDYLLTVDKKFLKKAARLDLPLKVINPINFPVGGAI